MRSTNRRSSNLPTQDFANQKLAYVLGAGQPSYIRFANGKGYFNSEKLFDYETNRVYGELYSELLLYEHFIERAALRLRVYKDKLKVQLD